MATEGENRRPETRPNKQIIFGAYTADGEAPKESNMEVRQGESPLSLPPGDDDGRFLLLVKNLYLSCDPYMRGRMRNYHKSYIPAFSPGQVIEGYGVSRVLVSNDPRFKEGDFVVGMTGWEEYSVIRDGKELRKIERDDDIPLSYYLGLLGMPGLTAYAGFFKICCPKLGEKEVVFVSAASGAVGQLVGQFAKNHGCYVVGSAGTAEKVEILKNKLGFDEAFNYKEESDLDAALKRYCPDGIDIYFDNVGGRMLDAVLLNMKNFGRIAVCGMISQHGISNPIGIHNLYIIVSRRVKIQGFIQSDYQEDMFDSFQHTVTKGYKDGKFVYLEDVSEGLESAPAALVGLFSGKNTGKKVVCVSRE